MNIWPRKCVFFPTARFETFESQASRTESDVITEFATRTKFVSPTLGRKQSLFKPTEGSFLIRAYF